jgi:hypothetical protein
MLEKWNNGMAPFGQINAYGGDARDHWFCRKIFYLDKSQHEMLLFLYSTIPSFQYSIIPPFPL